MIKKSKFIRKKNKKRIHLKEIKRKPFKNKKIRFKKKNYFFNIKVLFSIILILLSLLIFYTLFIFPKILNKKLKNELIEIYKPIIYDDSQFILILKIRGKPEIDIQNKTYKIIKEKYGLDTMFDKIKSNLDKGINKISFYRNNNKFSEIKSIYIFWDENLNIEESIKISKNELNYEKIEEKRKNEKQEKLVIPDINQFKYGTYNENIITNEKPKIAIVIDDVGYSYNSTYDFLTLGIPVTFALLPDMQESDKFYQLFRKYDYSIILHIPMEPIKGKKYVEKNAIFTDMSNEEIKNKITNYLNKYPDVIGANNHMGSKVISDARVMNVILNELSERNKFWLDSITNLNTISKEIAALHNLSYYERDVFLDNDKNINEIRKAMDNLIKEAKKNGKAVGIGHIQTKELVQVLKEYYDKKDTLNIEFVPLDKLK